MPSAFSHAIVGSTLVACGLPRPHARLVALGAVVAAVPDLDVLGIAVGWGLDHPLGHRGLSHSLVVAIALAGLATLAVPVRPAERPWRPWLILALAAYNAAFAFVRGDRKDRSRPLLDRAAQHPEVSDRARELRAFVDR